MKAASRQAEHLALKFRMDVGLSSREPVGVKTLIRKLGILIMYRPLSPTFWGLSTGTADGRYKFILVNSNSTRGRQHFTVAHELYHLFYDNDPRPHFSCHPGKEQPEVMADAFAAALLMPYEGIMENIPAGEIKSRRISLGTILRMEQFYGVSHQSMTLRMKDLELITPYDCNRYNSVPISVLARDYGLDTALYEPGNENLTIGDMGMKARVLFEEEKISEGHYIEILNMLK